MTIEGIRHFCMIYSTLPMVRSRARSCLPFLYRITGDDLILVLARADHNFSHHAGRLPWPLHFSVGSIWTETESKTTGGSRQVILVTYVNNSSNWVQPHLGILRAELTRRFWSFSIGFHCIWGWHNIYDLSKMLLIVVIYYGSHALLFAFIQAGSFANNLLI